ncbi:MAG: helix-turn-helix domain-containing protein [Rhodobacterales bacterium]
MCDDTCLETFANDILPDAPDAGVLLTGLRDAVLGPVEIADLRRHLPDWVIIVIDHAGTAHSAADALAAGADDVSRMPFPAHELLARVALRMRQAGMAEKSVSLETPLIARAQLTPVEADIMRILLSHKGQIVTRNQLSQQLDKSEWLYGDRKFDVHITRIRKKLKAAFGHRYLVCTIRSKGYLVQFSDEAESG